MASVPTTLLASTSHRPRNEFFLKRTRLFLENFGYKVDAGTESDRYADD
jgi:hypothetical protein